MTEITWRVDNGEEERTLRLLGSKEVLDKVLSELANIIKAEQVIASVPTGCKGCGQ